MFYYILLNLVIEHVFDFKFTLVIALEGFFIFLNRVFYRIKNAKIHKSHFNKIFTVQI